jgi:octaprenyl-diphosphate synthase
MSLPLKRTRDRSPQGDAIDVDPSRFLALIAGKLEATEALFRRHLASDVPFITETGDYLFSGGGKRMRPALLLLSSRLLEHDGEEEITYAAVVELIHTATLVHDDIIDHSELRRGQATVNSVWGNSKTVLLGDWLYTTSMQLALKHGRIEVIRRLCEATLRMTEGELLVLQRLAEPDISVDEYFDIIDRKTARLFAAACSIPALIPPSSPRQHDALEQYGRALGTCFQLVDDLLDFTSSEDDLGKPVLSDLKGGKLTLPLILLLSRIDASERRPIEQVLSDGSFDHVDPGEILDLVEREGTIEEVRELAADQAATAREALEVFPASEARLALEFAPEFVLNRRS